MSLLVKMRPAQRFGQKSVRQKHTYRAARREAQKVQHRLAKRAIAEERNK